MGSLASRGQGQASVVDEQSRRTGTRSNQNRFKKNLPSSRTTIRTMGDSIFFSNGPQTVAWFVEHRDWFIETDPNPCSGPAADLNGKEILTRSHRYRIKVINEGF